MGNIQRARPQRRGIGRYPDHGRPARSPPPHPPRNIGARRGTSRRANGKFRGGASESRRGPGGGSEYRSHRSLHREGRFLWTLSARGVHPKGQVGRRRLAHPRPRFGRRRAQSPGPRGGAGAVGEKNRDRENLRPRLHRRQGHASPLGPGFRGSLCGEPAARGGGRALHRHRTLLRDGPR